MPNSRQTSVIASPSNSRPTKRRRSCVTEHSFHGINTSRPKAKSVTHVSGTVCHRPLRAWVWPATGQQFASARQRLKASGWRGIELGPVELLLNAVKGFFADLAPRAQALQCRALGGDRA